MLILLCISRVLTFKDIPGKNFSIKEEPFLIETTVQYYGQPLAIILAGTYCVIYCMVLAGIVLYYILYSISWYYILYSIS